MSTHGWPWTRNQAFITCLQLASEYCFFYLFIFFVRQNILFRIFYDQRTQHRDQQPAKDILHSVLQRKVETGSLCNLETGPLMCGGSLIVLGSFNCGWTKESMSSRYFAYQNSVFWPRLPSNKHSMKTLDLFYSGTLVRSQTKIQGRIARRKFDIRI